VPSYAGPSAARSGDVAGTLRLLAYLGLAVTLVILDHHGGWLSQWRRQADLLVQPLWAVAGFPGQVVERIGEDAGTVSSLGAENRRLRNDLLVASARLARLQAATADNARLRQLLGAVERGGLDVQLAPILDIDLDPTRQRLVLDAGSGDGVRVGQVAIDAGGVVGQIIATTPAHATVLLLTDPDHALPVALVRNGVRLVAHGTGRSDRLALGSIPLSSDVKVGDLVVTSGLGERFPAGFPIGRIVALRPDDSRAFLTGEVEPAAQLDRGRDVLLLRHAPARPVIGSAGSAEGAAPASGPSGAVAPSQAPAGTPATRPAPARPSTPGSKGNSTQAGVDPAPSQQAGQRPEPTR